MTKNSSEFLEKLENLLRDRKQTLPEGSYTTTLFKDGIQKILQKVGEESIEYILDAQAGNKERAVYEGADLLYHFLVSLAAQDLSLDTIIHELERRHQ